MPAPRLSSSAADRSNTSTSQPRSRRTSAAVSPPSEPPTTAAGYGRPKPARVGDAALKHPPPLVHGRVAEAVGRLGAGVLGPRLVDGLGGPVPLDLVVLMDLPLDGG